MTISSDWNWKTKMMIGWKRRKMMIGWKRRKMTRND
jgi:hypothetical protein